jgi:hypothetical protein
MRQIENDIRVRAIIDVFPFVVAYLLASSVVNPASIEIGKNNRKQQ